MIEYIGVGKIPIRNYLINLDRRCYSPDLVIEYTKDIYGVDISEEIKDEALYWSYKDINVYDLFNEKFPVKIVDDGTREYFNKTGRNRYYKFYSKYKENDGYWDLPMDWSAKADVTHHIFPIVFGGNSNPMNLLPVTDLNHKLLHENSVEEKRECCFMAVDYLSYLHSLDSIKDLNEKYNIIQYKDMDSSFRYDFMSSIFEKEMKDFYKKLKEGN